MNGWNGDGSFCLGAVMLESIVSSLYRSSEQRYR